MDEVTKNHLARAKEYLPPGYAIVPVQPSDEMKSAYGEAVYFTTDTRILPENIWRAMIDASTQPQE